MPPACGLSDPLAVFGDGEFLRAIFCTFGDTATVGGVVLISWFTLSAMAYVRTESITMPLVLLLLMGGATTALLPAPGLRVVAIALAAGGAVIAIIALRSLDRI